MTNKNRGFILLMTLLVILVISLLGITCLHHVLLYHKAVNSLEVQHYNFYQLEHLAIELASVKTSQLDKDCILHKDLANGVIVQLKKQQGCLLVLGTSKYYYFIEDLGDFPCLKVYESGLNYSTHHRRVTLMLLGENGSHSLVQIRYIIPIQNQTCVKTVRTVRSGISSWRYFSAS